jgi:hypothetical protein
MYVILKATLILNVCSSVCTLLFCNMGHNLIFMSVGCEWSSAIIITRSISINRAAADYTWCTCIHTRSLHIHTRMAIYTLLLLPMCYAIEMCRSPYDYTYIDIIVQLFRA